MKSLIMTESATQKEREVKHQKGRGGILGIRKKGYAEVLEEQEGPAYDPGAF